MDKNKLDVDDLTGVEFELDKDESEEMVRDYLEKKGEKVPEDDDLDVTIWNEYGEKSVG